MNMNIVGYITFKNTTWKMHIMYLNGEWRCGVESFGTGQCPAEGSCQNGNDTSHSIKTATLT
jgi:hypothetical protein